MKLEHQLLKTKPREEAGSKTSRKYTFQKNLSLLLLIEQHDKREDYVFLFDFHDDLAILDSSKNPTLIDFYQIKSKDKGNWTITKLTKAENKKLSILGKLFLNKIKFSDYTKSLNFITNANFSFLDLKDGTLSTSKTKIIATDMDDKDICTCNTRIQTEHKLDNNPEFEKNTQFHVTILSNKDSSTHCIGSLSTLIDSINKDNKINPVLAYNQIINEITRKTGSTVEDKSFNHLSQLIKLKGITKSQFISYLEKAGLYKSVEEEWNEINFVLINCGLGFVELTKYKKSWRDIYLTEIRNPNSIPLQELKDKINRIYQDRLCSEIITDSMSLINIIDSIYCNLETKIFDEYFIKCLIIRVINEN